MRATTPGSLAPSPSHPPPSPAPSAPSPPGCSATVSMLCGEAVTTLQRCDDGLALARAGGYGLGIPYMTVNRGWAIAVLGDAAEGEARIIEGTLIAEAFGAEYLRGFFRAVRAQVCLLAGRREDAYIALHDGLSIIE